MSGRVSRAVCFVCRLAGSPKDPLFSTTMRNLKSGRLVALSVHYPGCWDAVLATHEPLEEEPTVSKSDISGPPPDMTAADAASTEDHRGQDQADPTPPAPPAAPDELTTEQALDYLLHGTPIPDTITTTRQREMLQRIIDSESVADLLTEQVFRTASEVQYTVVVVQGFTWRLGQLREGGPPFYALVDLVVESSGARELISADDDTIMVQLVRAEEQGWLPLRCQIEPGGMDFRADHPPLWLKATNIPAPVATEQSPPAPRL